MHLVPKVSTALETLLLSVFGIAISIVIYIFVTTFVCCGRCSIVGMIKEKFFRHKKEEDVKERKILLSNDQLIAIFVVFHVVAHLVLLAVDITCLSTLPDDSWHNATNQSSEDLNTTSRETMHVTLLYSILLRLPSASLYYETGSLFSFPVLCALSMVWSQFKMKSCSVKRYLRMIRFADVYMCLLTAPFSYSSLLRQGGVWYAIVAVRLVCHATIFTAAVVAGMTVMCFVCYFIPTPEVDVPVKSSEIEISGFHQLFITIAFRIGPIAISFYTASSALNTYLKLSTLYTLNAVVEVFYIALTLGKGAVSLFRLGVSALLLRWNLLADNSKSGDSAMKIMKFLNHTELHIHLLFVADMVVYGGLIALNLYMVVIY